VSNDPDYEATQKERRERHRSAARAARATPEEIDPEVVEIHAETLLDVAAECERTSRGRIRGSSNYQDETAHEIDQQCGHLLRCCDAIRAFLGKATDG
jgi:thioesterase domain-containing protein